MFILAALDSSVVPTLGGVDALTVVLASLHPERWPYYALCSMAGSVCGASGAYRLSRLGILHPRIKGAAFDRVTAFLHRFGSLSLSLAAFLPPPFPTSAFVIGAGVTRYPFISFVLSFGMARVCPFALLILADRKVTLSTGHLLVLDCGVSHDVEALEESALLLTISWQRGRSDALESFSSAQRRLDDEALSRMNNEGNSNQPT